MIPKTLSATSLQVAGLCMDRWVAEYLNYTPGFSNNAANVGLAFHGGAEKFVEACYLEKTQESSLELLVSFYNMSYMAVFKTADLDTPEYQDGLALTKRWYKRTEFEGFTVLSVEKKETIKVPFNHPDGGVQEVNFNYIMDRLDQIDETTFRVVDYKTVRVPIQPEDLETKVQARAYALAVQIKFPLATKIIVEFDLIRHDPVGFVFTRDDNIAFWRYLCAETQRIVDTNLEDVRPTLNMECGYCVKKFSCELMQKNISAGGFHSLSPAEAADMKYALEAQMKANKLIVEQLEEKLLMHAANEDTLQWDTEDGAYEVQIAAQRRRTFDASRVPDIIGPELFSRVGNMTLGELDKLINDESLTEKQRNELKGLVSYSTGSPRAKIKPKTKVV